MLNTNQIQTALETANNTAQIVRAQISPWLPALAVASAWLGRELTRLADYAERAAPKIIARGGLVKIAAQLIYNSSDDHSPSQNPECLRGSGRGQG